jgi:hypothetical protein
MMPLTAIPFSFEDHNSPASGDMRSHLLGVLNAFVFFFKDREDERNFGGIFMSNKAKFKLHHVAIFYLILLGRFESNITNTRGT